MGVYYALLLLIVVLAIITTYLDRANYLSVLNLSNVVYQSSLIAIMAVAMTVVLISGNFDLSVASVAAFAAVLLIGNADAIGFWPAAALGHGRSHGQLGLLNGVIVQYRGHQRLHCDARHHDRRTRSGADLYRRPLAIGIGSGRYRDDEGLRRRPPRCLLAGRCRRRRCFWLLGVISLSGSIGLATLYAAFRPSA